MIECEDVISRGDALKALDYDIKSFEFKSGVSRHMNEIANLLNTIYEIQSNNIKALPPVQPKPNTGHWIPVSEKLPKTSGVYRVTRYYPNKRLNRNYIVDACYFDGSDTWYSDNRINHGRPCADNVIAWQENPEPYKPQESEEANADSD